MKMNTLQAAKFVGLPPEILIKMRTRITSTLNSGPPFAKTVDELGQTSYVYLKADLERWMHTRSCRLTAGEAAMLLQITRLEIMELPPAIYPLQKPGGALFIDPVRNIYVFKNKKLLNKIRGKRVA